MPHDEDASPRSGSMEHGSVSTVIVTHNEGDMLRRTVDSFLQAPDPPDEIVVVDDCSTDGSTSFLREGYEGVELLPTPSQQGIARARNFGGRHAKGDVLVFSDAHVGVDGGWLGPIVEALADPAVGEVAPSVGYLDGRPGIGHGFTWDSASLKMAWLHDGTESTHDVPFLCGCFVAMRRDTFEKTGGFDDGMYRWGYEDSELSLRLWLSGWRVQTVPSSFIRHHFRDNFTYEVDESGVIYNALRLATIHFDELALSRVLAHYASSRDFGRAWVRLVDSDTWARRKELSGTVARDIRWFIERFSIDVLS